MTKRRNFDLENGSTVCYAMEDSMEDLSMEEDFNFL
jgi:hypothetical protein